MEQRKVTNLLLLVIAVCLVLIVVHLYGLSLIQPADAAQAASQKQAGERLQRVEVANDGPLAVGFVYPQKVELVFQGRNGNFFPLANQDGQLACLTARSMD
jgi:hypothetical protein